MMYEVKAIKDWPSHFVKRGGIYRCEPFCEGYCVEFPVIGFTVIGEKKAKRYFEITKLTA